VRPAVARVQAGDDRVPPDVAHAQLGQRPVPDRHVATAARHDRDRGHDQRHEDGDDRPRARTRDGSGYRWTPLPASGGSRRLVGQTVASWMARQTRSAVQGMSTCSEQNAYDPAATYGPYEIAPNERAWSQCVYQAVRTFVEPTAMVPARFEAELRRVA